MTGYARSFFISVRHPPFFHGVLFTACHGCTLTIGMARRYPIAPMLVVMLLTAACCAVFSGPAPVHGAFGDCPEGYFFDRMSGVGCKQTHCADVPHGHWSYEGYCVCGSSGSTQENPLDPNKECYLPREDTSCSGCLAKCVHFNEPCPGEEKAQTTLAPAPIQGGDMTPYEMLKDAFSKCVSIGSDLLEWGTGAKINERDDPDSFYSGLFITPGGDKADVKFFAVNAAANKKEGLALEWNVIEIKTPGHGAFVDGWSLGVGPGSVSKDGASVNVPSTPISPNINFGNIRAWAGETWDAFTGWYGETMPWFLGGANRPAIPGYGK